MPLGTGTAQRLASPAVMAGFQGGQLMMSHLTRIAAVTTAAVLASACVKVPGAPAPGFPGMPSARASSGAPVYQLVMAPAVGQALSGVIRLNTSTGQTVTAWGAPSQMTTVPDSPLPAGHYRLQSWSELSGDGVTWGASRLDEVSGRVWVLVNCASTCAWIELTPPSK
jgi:hypothetical protein